MTGDRRWATRWRALLLAVMATGALAGCAVMKTSSLALTPVVSPPTDVHHPGAFVWHDLLTHDVPVARNFYSQVFGWSFEEHGRYTVVLNEGKPIAGIVALDPKQAQGSAARWLTTWPMRRSSWLPRAESFTRARCT